MIGMELRKTMIHGKSAVLVREEQENGPLVEPRGPPLSTHHHKKKERQYNKVLKQVLIPPSFIGTPSHGSMLRMKVPSERNLRLRSSQLMATLLGGPSPIKKPSIASSKRYWVVPLATSEV